MSRRSWIRVTLSLSEAHQDLLTGQLSPIGFTGFFQEGKVLHCFTPKPNWTPALRKKVVAILARFRTVFPAADIRFTVTTLADQNWNAVWERTAGIVEATDGIIIKPSWKRLRARDRGKIILHIDPKMSFGTGHHESTLLCLVLL
ncbi:MAG: 50S ribosomal protein L11 methyltransferase, partial [Bacteroidota bacterium]